MSFIYFYRKYILLFLKRTSSFHPLFYYRMFLVHKTTGGIKSVIGQQRNKYTRILILSSIRTTYLDAFVHSSGRNISMYTVDSSGTMFSRFGPSHLVWLITMIIQLAAHKASSRRKPEQWPTEK